jgi:hypothetical protein
MVPFGRAARGTRQSQASQGGTLAQPQSLSPHALQVYRLLVADYGRTLTPRPDRQSAVPGVFSSVEELIIAAGEYLTTITTKSQALYFDCLGLRHPV